MTHIHEDDLVLHYYGEMQNVDEVRVTTHLGACAACAEQYRRLQQVLGAVEAGALAEAPDNFERMAWARLEPNLERSGRRTGWRGWVVLAPAHLALAAAVVVLVAGAFFAGRLFPGGADRERAASAETVRERILLVDLGDHLDRSQMVLVEVVSADEGSVDMSAERDRAEQLLAANRLYRQTALNAGEPRIAQVLDELERVLVDVAASPDRLDATDLDSMRRRIESKGLLFKVRVVSSEVRERQRSVVGS
jgi:anti-sigma factor RsiW